MNWQRLLFLLLNQASLILFLGVCAVFGILSDRFLEPQNLVNVLVQSSSTAILAIGMTFVLLTAGVDLSVGSIMFLAAAVGGKLMLAGHALPIAIVCMGGVGLAFGALNALLVTRLGLLAFVVTLATQYAGRGLGLRITETRAMNLPDSFLRFGSAQCLGIPVPVLLLVLVLALAHAILRQTAFGRHIYAIGFDAHSARKAGLPVQRILAAVYVICGGCAALGGIVSLSQLGAVSPTFGLQKEFAAIAAAVLGGTSLFGGRGQVFPGTVLGAVMIQTVENGLVILNADPYLYPLITSAIIFTAVLVDSSRHRLLQRLARRPIRVESQPHDRSAGTPGAAFEAS
jgi:ribose transport system permease protein